MNAKVISFQSHKRNKLRDGLSLFEYIAILLNVALLFSVGIGFVLLMFDPPATKWFGKAVSILVSGLVLYHFLKVWRIFKTSTLIENMSYLYNYVMYVMITSALFSLFSIGIISEPFLVKVKWICIVLLPALFNLFVTIKLHRRGII